MIVRFTLLNLLDPKFRIEQSMKIMLDIYSKFNNPDYTPSDAQCMNPIVLKDCDPFSVAIFSCNVFFETDDLDNFTITYRVYASDLVVDISFYENRNLNIIKRMVGWLYKYLTDAHSNVDVQFINNNDDSAHIVRFNKVKKSLEDYFSKIGVRSVHA